MEMTIPPRDHGPSTYRYTWDENGEIAQVTRVRDSSRFSTAARPIPGRQTAQWPFQSIITTTPTDVEPPSPPSPPRRHSHRRTTSASALLSAWEHPDQPHPQSTSHTSRNPSNGSSEGDPSSASRTSSLIPDYVLTFLRLSNSSTPPKTTSDPQQHQHPLIPHHDRYYFPATTTSNLRGGCGGEAEHQRTGTPEHRGVELVVPPQELNAQHRSRVADLEFEGFYFDGDDEPNGNGNGSGHDRGNDCDGASLERVDSREAGDGGQGQRGEEERGFLASSVWDGVPVEFVGEKKGGYRPGRRGCRGCLSGWRVGIAVNVLAVFVVLMVGFVCVVAAISRAPLDAGRSAFFVGSCATARGIDWGLHAVISVFVVILVAGANYAFQVIGSPTREEVMAAHLGRAWVDIGVPSLRNIGRIGRSRGFLAVVLLVTAVLTQVMYNAAIYVSQTAPNYKAAIVTESFLSGAPFSNEASNNVGRLSRLDLETLQQRATRGELVRLPTPTCISQLGGDFEAEYSAILLISKPNAVPLIQTFTGAIRDLVPSQSSIQYCLALPAPAPTCEVNLNASLLGSVALLNSIALIATAAVLFKRPSSFRPLVTLGDAISSLLEDPDPTTQGACLLSKSDVRHGRWPLQESKFWAPRTHRWLRSVSAPRWITTFSVWVVCVSLAAGALAFSLTSPTMPGQLSPFGTPSPHVLIPLPATTPPAAAAVIAALPQLLLVVLYFTTNALLTAYYLSHESSLFATGPARPLRVSADAEGAQTTSLHLTLPIPVSALLMLWFMGMAFVLSQSFFAASVRLVDVSLSADALGSETGGVPLVALGVSGVGFLVLLVMLVLLAVAVLGLGLRRAPGVGVVNGQMVGNPMALPGGSCSAVMSARCHPLAREKRLWRKPVMWGVVREGVGFGVSHCGFTAGRAGVVEAGRNYA